MRNKKLWFLPLTALLFLTIWLWQRNQPAIIPPAESSFLSLLSAPAQTGFARAVEPDGITFPTDLGPHNDYQTEWWYYTGNLQTAEGRPFGYQLTFFRNALSPDPPPSGSNWRSNQIYLAHFTISDIEAGDFYPAEKFSRGAIDLAGATAVPYHVWLDHWFVKESPDGRITLFAQTDAVELSLSLSQTLPPILHGDGGLSQKGAEPGNASYYYSLIQQKSDGTVTIGDTQYTVSGLSWKDHEYSTSALQEGAVGWDWFSLQFANGGGLMFFQIRHADGRIEPYSSGTLIFPDGRTAPLKPTDWSINIIDYWESPATGARYPVGWEIAIPKHNLFLNGQAMMPNQELRVSTTYWEGASAFTGSWNGEPITANGYVEMTGYDR